MAENQTQRKLTAILSADVKGYSRLMGEDDESTVDTITAYRRIVTELINTHQGRVVDTPGDNILAEFGSALNAVNGAIEIQRTLEIENGKLPDDRRMEFRIGINLGDILHKDDRIYGDGVNVAARIESLADPGGISISRGVFDQVKRKIRHGFEYLGEHNVKNITEPVRIYRILSAPEFEGKVIGEPATRPTPIKKSTAIAMILIASVVLFWMVYSPHFGRESTSITKVTAPELEKASIAVLPFDNMSNDPEQDYFSDGIAEDIITDLSKISGLIVIARNSSFAYKKKSVNAQQIGQELRVRYLLEGSVRKVGSQVRINAQLIDASSGHHLWADRYDGDMSDIFALQDQISRKILSALALKLTVSQQKALADKGTDDIQAYDSFLKGWQGYRLLTKAGFAEAKLHLEKAVELDPEFSRAYAALAALYWKAVQTASPELREGLGLTSRAARNAVRNKPHLLVKKAMRNPTALAHGLMSQMYLFRYQHDEALSEIEQAVAMDPNDPELYAWMSHILWLIGQNSKAIESAKMGLRLDPNNPTAYLNNQARAYLPDGNLEESLMVLERAKRLNPELSGSFALTESIIYGIQGRKEEARTAYDIYLKSRQHPVRNLNDILLYLPFADPKKLDLIADALIKAGAPGKPIDYYRIVKVNRLNGQEAQSLLLGHKITGISMSTGKPYGWEWKKNGEFKITGAYQDSGQSWVEGDVFFIKFEKLFSGLPYGTVIYRNPDGSVESQNQYLMVSDMGSITPFASTE
jgi:TolB-like protein/class 3 adenylate cyclase